MEKVVLFILTLLAALGAAIIYWGPVKEYVVACERAGQVVCYLEQTKATGTSRWQIQPGQATSAAVRVVSRRRGGDSVYLYLVSTPHEVFAAQFEGPDAASEAKISAERLNKVLKGTAPGSERVEVRPPRYLSWMAWGAIGLMASLIVAMFGHHVRPRARA